MKINKEKIFRILIPVASVISILVVVGILFYVNSEQDKISCGELTVLIQLKGSGKLLSEKEIREMVSTLCEENGGKASALSTAEIENSIEQFPTVKNAEVYRRVSGELVIDIEERTPICRIQELSGTDYYMDDTGELFPLVKGFAARVPLVNGNLKEPYAYRRGIMNSDSLKTVSMLDDVFALFRVIRKDPFMHSLVEQVWISESGEFELIPKIDDHVIVFGDTTHMEGKCNKLKIFYEEGLNTKGWNLYQTIDLKYQNQIICKK